MTSFYQRSIYFLDVKGKTLAGAGVSAIIGLKLSEMENPKRKRFDYAVALLGYLKERGGVFVDIGKVAEASGLPQAYLEKVAQGLRVAGWLESRKGSSGGYRLVSDREDVSVEAIINFYNPVREFCPLLRAMKK